MAAPFYNEADQAIYEGGEHFIPQEQYRLNYTPSTALASTVGNTGGVTGTQAAYPYLWPPQGDGGGGGFGTNKYGLDLSTQKTIQQGKWVGNEYVKTPRKIAKTEGGIWKDVDTNQNVYHGGYNVKTPMTMIMDKVFDKKTTGDPYKDTWYGHGEWDDEEMNIGDRRTIPQNMIQRWQENREIKKQEKLAADKVISDQAITARTDPGTPGSTTYGTKKGATETYDRPGAKGSPGYHWAQGGRVGYRTAGPVLPEDENENVFQIMQDQGIPFSDQVEAGPTEEQVAMVIDMDGRGMEIEDIMSITQLGRDTIMSILGVEMAQGGIASVV